MRLTMFIFSCISEHLLRVISPCSSPLTQVENVHHGLQPQRVVQRDHGHGVGVAGQL